MGRNGMEWDGWSETGGMGQDEGGWDGVGWAEVKWNGMRWDEMSQSVRQTVSPSASQSVSQSEKYNTIWYRTISQSD